MTLIQDIINTLEQLDVEVPKKKCICPNCGYETETPMGVPCASINCPKCGTPLTRKIEQQEEQSESEKIKAILKFDKNSPSFVLVDEEGNEIFRAVEKTQAIANLLSLNSNPSAEDAVACAMEKGECEVEVEIGG